LSADQKELARLHEAAGLDPIEVHAAGKVRGVELDRVVAGVNVAVDELGDLLAEGVVHLEHTVLSATHTR